MSRHHEKYKNGNVQILFSLLLQLIAFVNQNLH